MSDETTDLLLTEKRRREVWMRAMLDAMRAGLEAGFPDPRSLPDPVVNTKVRALLDDTWRDMNAADNDDRRNELYERHRALSSIVQELDRPGPVKN